MNDSQRREAGNGCSIAHISCQAVRRVAVGAGLDRSPGKSGAGEYVAAILGTNERVDKLGWILCGGRREKQSEEDDSAAGFHIFIGKSKPWE